MTINPQTMQALGRERTANVLREAAAYRRTGEANRTGSTSQTATPPRPRPSAPQDLIPAGAEER